MSAPGKVALDTGKGRQLCSVPDCGLRSIAGMVRGHGKCGQHWAEMNWGKEWAAKCYPVAALDALRAELRKGRHE